MLMDTCLINFDNYEGIVALNCFNNHRNCSCSFFFFYKKKFQSDVQSEVHFVRSSIISIGQSVLVNKEVILSPGF